MLSEDGAASLQQNNNNDDDDDDNNNETGSSSFSSSASPNNNSRMRHTHNKVNERTSAYDWAMTGLMEHEKILGSQLLEESTAISVKHLEDFIMKKY